MDKLDVKEKIWGGIFGAIAIIAAIAEMMANGLSAASVFGAIKDVSGTAVVVLILCAFLKGIKRPKKIAEILETAVEDWGNKNAPLIFKAEGYQAPNETPQYTQGFVLLQDPKKYAKLVNDKLTTNHPDWHKYAAYTNSNKLTGKFLNMPSYDKMTQDKFDVLITMTQSHFSKMDNIDNLISDIKSATNSHCSERVTAIIDEKRKIKLTCNKINTKDDVKTFVDELDFILSLVKVIA